MLLYSFRRIMIFVQEQKSKAMKKNMGVADKRIRLAVAAIVAILYFMGILTGTAAIVAGIIAVIFVLTSFISFCPLYLPFGISTNKTKK